MVIVTPGKSVRSGDVVADIVADVVAATRRGTALYSRSRFHAPWGIRVEAAALASVHVVTAGACWLIPDDGEPVHLIRGDVAFVPSGLGHALVDSPGRPLRSMTELIGGPLGEAAPRELVIEGDGPVTGLLCGGYLLEPGPRHPLTAMLPSIVHVGAGQARGTGLSAAVDLLSAEFERTDPGAPAVVASLIDLLFVYMLRAWLAEQSGGWAGALYDPAVGGALALVHADPGRPWSVPLLARAVGVPRATFNRRFTTMTGQSPMAYVTAWRMTVAARILREGRAPLREVAQRVGYDSEFAFARAFKRVVGQAPGHYRANG
ncbi:AraC family transcriptional regulator [Actinocrispum wychmicini]|uniref:AraC-like DNA-binding protein n=1 Tax=Actinocrispum wychmicini TaxID=1213861 RepID=A0A4R2K3C6_9PSEU|nr:AraC family transcriptional regulator [Actinocrispum wychmicini]TCO64296.1 AraC-like DNA-binding protein [Actinocrispum wychmicini]